MSSILWGLSLAKTQQFQASLVCQLRAGPCRSVAQNPQSECYHPAAKFLYRCKPYLFSHKRVYKIANVIESECYHPAAKFLYRFLRFLCPPSSPPDATAPRRARSGTTPTTPSGRSPRSGFFPEESSHPGPALQHRRPATNHVIAVKRL